jgi:hypothetical protein
MLTKHNWIKQRFTKNGNWHTTKPMVAPTTSSAMEPNPHLATTSDLEIRVARIADPNIGMFIYCFLAQVFQISI